ncbi:MAG: ABC transporter permease [Phycisphaerae bacterium]|nr:ABC transporter permease [Phycisphaerae bacterium]
MGTLWQDIRYGLRTLARNPGFTTVIVLVLGLGIGVTTAVFSVVSAVLLRPLPFPNVDRLVMVWETEKGRPGSLEAIMLPQFLDWRDQCPDFEAMAFFEWGAWEETLTGVEEPARVVGARIDPQFFSVLGVVPLLGRPFTAEEGREGGPPVVILSHGMWTRRFGGDPEIIDKTIVLNQKPRTVVGVMGSDFRHIGTADFWMPFPMNIDSVAPVGPGAGRGAHGAYVVGRLKPNVARARAEADLEVIAKRRTQYPVFEPDRGVRLTSLHEHLVRDSRRLLCVFQAAALLVLLVATANVANLMLVRSETRSREMSLRAALGAGRARIIRQLFTESSLLALMGGSLGALLALWGAAGLGKAAASFLPRMEEVNLDWRVLAFTSLVSLMSGLLSGLAPAVRAMRMDPNECLKEGGAVRGLVGSHRNATRHMLVIAEIGLSLVLLIGAGLFLKSFVLLNQVRLGFDPKNVLVAQVPGVSEALSGPQGPELLERLSSLPGVQAVGAATALPPRHSGTQMDMTIGEDPVEHLVCRQEVTPDYFRAMGVPLVRGRAITEQDVEGSPHVVVVNETFVKRVCGGVDPIGKELVIHPDNPAIPRRRSIIVGVVRDVANQTLLGATEPEAYYSYRQGGIYADSLVLRIGSDPWPMVIPVRDAIQETIGKDHPIAIETMRERLAGSILPQRFQTIIIVLFSAIGLALAAVGIYGVISYSVAQRVREFGIRIAVGAQRAAIMRLVVRRALWLVAGGLALGLTGAVALTRVLRTFLFAVAPLDAVTFATVSIFLGSVVLLASYLPARRAAKVDPMVALRYE